MKIYVCVKQVPDTAVNIKIQGENDFEKQGCKFVVNPYDEFAIEEAIIIAQKNQGEVIVITVGAADAIGTVRNALAMGADRGILVKSDHYFLNSMTTALALKKAIESDGSPDLIFTGRNSVDSEGMQTQYRLANEFNMGVVNEVTDLKSEDGRYIVEREIEGGGKQVVEIKTPCVIGTTKGINEPRYPKLPEILKAKKKEVKELSIEDLGLDSNTGIELVQLEKAKERTAAKIIDGSIPEAVDKLVQILRDEEKVI